MDVLQLTNNKIIMKENLIKPYCYCGESENSLVDNAIFVYFSDEYRRVLLDEILWVEASGSYCVIYMEDGAEITVSYPWIVFSTMICLVANLKGSTGRMLSIFLK